MPAVENPACELAAAIAAEAEIGFPQSMQKRDMGSFSRPQKAQATS